MKSKFILLKILNKSLTKKGSFKYIFKQIQTGNRPHRRRKKVPKSGDGTTKRPIP